MDPNQPSHSQPAVKQLSVADLKRAREAGEGVTPSVPPPDAPPLPEGRRHAAPRSSPASHDSYVPPGYGAPAQAEDFKEPTWYLSDILFNRWVILALFLCLVGYRFYRYERNARAHDARMEDLRAIEIDTQTKMHMEMAREHVPPNVRPSRAPANPQNDAAEEQRRLVEAQSMGESAGDSPTPREADPAPSTGRFEMAKDPP